MLAAGTCEIVPHASNPTAGSTGAHGRVKVPDPANPGSEIEKKYHLRGFDLLSGRNSDFALERIIGT